MSINSLMDYKYFKTVLISIYSYQRHRYMSYFGYKIR